MVPFLIIAGVVIFILLVVLSRVQSEQEWILEHFKEKQYLLFEYVDYSDVKNVSRTIRIGATNTLWEDMGDGKAPVFVGDYTLRDNRIGLYSYPNFVSRENLGETVKFTWYWDQRKVWKGRVITLSPSPQSFAGQLRITVLG